MILTENFKLIIVSLLCLTAYIQARSVVQLGDIHAVRTDDKWICDKIECPLNSERCFVSVSNEEDPADLKRVNICFGENNEILAQKNSSSTIDPNYRIAQYVTSYRDGSTTSSNQFSSTHFDEKQYNETMGEMENIFAELKQQNENLQKEMKALSESFNFNNFWG